MDFEKLDSIMSLSPAIRYVSIINSNGKSLARKIRADLEDKPDASEYNHLDIFIVRQIADIQQQTLGPIISFLTTRKQIHEFILYSKDICVYVTFDELPLTKRAEIVEKSIPIIKEMIPLE